ncbi:hypothetical protein [Pantoea sp. Taur]|uniref:hypothetical protein n=1 Tax=Pantoea sp. Taur TaxID=2576757 RepID=UPI001353C17B|nr:hypothetical protein [Pantoea sp. Taur]MXP59746.1 hypothetical protein [Pantoea sp. Taur]
MANKSFDFFKLLTFKVIVSINDESFTGTLSFGKGTIPHLSFDEFSKELSLSLKSISSGQDNIICRDRDSNVSLTLHAVEVRDLTIFCNYVSLGNSEFEFDTLEIFFTGLSTWFEQIQPFKNDGDLISCDISVDSFREEFIFNGVSYSIENNRRIDFESEGSLKTSVITEYSIILKKNSGLLGLNEASELCHEIRNLFSLLIGVFISIQSVNTYLSSNRARFKSLYFPSALDSQEPLSDKHHAFKNYIDIIRDDAWGDIFTNYFSKISFREIWNRLPTSYEYRGVWEYQILSRIIVLEMFASHTTPAKTGLMDENIFNQLKTKIKETLDSFESSLNLSDTDSEVYYLIKERVMGVKRSFERTLQGKYDFLMTQMNDDLKEIIGFTDEDFKLIKRFRNAIAHGNKYIKLSDDNNITYETQVSDRLLVLLMCFSYLEMGFTVQQIVSSLSNSRCSFIRNANINKRSLDKFNGSAKFIELSSPSEMLISNNVVFLAIKYSSQDDKYSIDERLSNKIKSDFFKSGVTSLADYVNSIVNYECELEMLHKVYLKCNDSETIHHSSILIKT